MDKVCESDFPTCNFITEKVVKQIIEISVNKDVTLKKYNVFNASDKMLGFLADYWKLQVHVNTSNNINICLNFFVKAISKLNAAKAQMVNEMKLFEKETTFYTKIKKKLDTPGIDPWSPILILSLKEAMIFEDLNCLQYKTRNKFKTFDKEHTLLALEALARFHAASINYEEKTSQSLKRSYYISDEHKEDLNAGGYRESDPWFIQCMDGALEIVKLFSKFKDDEMILNVIEKRWKGVWKSALSLADPSVTHRNVICHRDLWNNNILFRNEKRGAESVPVNCLLVDFQAVRYQPPAGDVMLLLYCNLEPQFREENLAYFLNHYYNETNNILSRNNVSLNEILSPENFLKTCNEQKLWGLVVSACLVPQFWIDDELTKEIFCDTSQFQDIMTKSKGSFIKRMMEENNNYKNKVLHIFEEIVDQYIL